MLLTRYPGKKSREPNWTVASDCIRAAKLLGITNYTTLAAAIGAANSPSDELRAVRNFFAHRYDTTALEVRSLSRFSTLSRLTSVGVGCTYTTGGVTIFADWAECLRAIALAAVQ